MSLSIIPYPVDTALQRALGSSPGVALQAKYIQVGKGLQEIVLDDAGRAITRSLLEPVAYLEIMHAEKITPYQWQLTIDAKQAWSGADFNLSEFALCDENQAPIAIYGNPTQALYAITAQLDNALLAINLVLTAFPADTIEIVHQNLPLKLFMTQEMAAMDVALGRLTLSQMQHFEQRQAWELEQQQQRAALEDRLLQQQQDHEQMIAMALQQMQLSMQQQSADQQLFNLSTEQGIATLSLGLMRSRGE